MRAQAWAAVGLPALAGSGGSDGKSSANKPKGTPDPQAKASAQAFLDAYTARDAKAICASLTPAVKKQLADNKGSCVKTLRFSIKGQTFPKLTVAQALVDG